MSAISVVLFDQQGCREGAAKSQDWEISAVSMRAGKDLRKDACRGGGWGCLRSVLGTLCAGAGALAFELLVDQ